MCSLDFCYACKLQRSDINTLAPYVRAAYYDLLFDNILYRSSNYRERGGQGFARGTESNNGVQRLLPCELI